MKKSVLFIMFFAVILIFCFIFYGFFVRAATLKKTECEVKAEVCDNVDNDNDGLVDEDESGNLLIKECYEGSDATEGVGECKKGLQECKNGKWGECLNQQLPEDENCENNLDNDCDGKKPKDDEDCLCLKPLTECRFKNKAWCEAEDNKEKCYWINLGEGFSYCGTKKTCSILSENECGGSYCFGLDLCYACKWKGSCKAEKCYTNIPPPQNPDCDFYNYANCEDEDCVNQNCRPENIFDWNSLTITRRSYYRCCGGKCMDTYNDNYNCGECDNNCEKQGKACDGGNCEGLGPEILDKPELSSFTHYIPKPENVQESLISFSEEGIQANFGHFSISLGAYWEDGVPFPNQINELPNALVFHGSFEF